MTTADNNPGAAAAVGTERRKWIKTWHAFGLHFAVSNGRLKKRDDRRHPGGKNQYADDRMEIFDRQKHRCPLCGKKLKSHKQMNAHHVLPWCRFPELRNRKENLLLLCPDCHKEVHANPWLNIRLMQKKAAQLGIDLRDRYGCGAENIT